MGFSACVTYKCKPPKPPYNLKSIDCEDYNDVATVYWHLQRDCEKGLDDFVTPPPCGTLWLKGWGRRNSDGVFLCPDSISAASINPQTASNGVCLCFEGTGADWYPKNVAVYYTIMCTSVIYQESCCSYNQHYTITLGGYIIKEVENEE